VSGQKLGAARFESFGRREEILAEVQRRYRALGHEPHAVLSCDVGKTARNIRWASEHHPFDLGADRR
jgi:hypothetical protein